MIKVIMGVRPFASTFGLMLLSGVLGAAQCEDSVEPGDVPGTEGDTGQGEDTGQSTESEGTDSQPGDGATVIADYDGIDMIVVVDNSASMAEEQEILTTGIYSLVTQLTHPLSVDPDWGFPPVERMRVAVTTSDMGLQWGGGQTGGNVIDVVGCAGLGDNGDFSGQTVTTVELASGVIKCEPGGGQCPEGFDCIESRCEAIETSTVNCPITDGWAEIGGGDTNDDSFALTAACMAQQGTDGCGVEQPLEAAVRALESHPEFLVADHLLAVLVVSDEEDCSIASDGLFQTNEWRSGAGELLNTACNAPKDNEQYLYTVEDYRSRLVALKGGDADGVVFGAIVGVPAGEDSPCQGDGETVASLGCLDHDTMQLVPQEFYLGVDEVNVSYIHFAPACERYVDGAIATTARPGRRFVSLAQDFGVNGFVYSICNADWNPAMESIAEIAAERMGGASAE